MKSAGVVVYMTVPLPVAILFVLVIRGVTLNGAGTGIAMMLTPDLTVLGDPDIW